MYLQRPTALPAYQGPFNCECSASIVKAPDFKNFIDIKKLNCNSFIHPLLFNRTKIRLGEHEISHPGQDCDIKNNCNAGSQDFDIAKIIIHPEYNSPNTFQNDIAIVKLDRKVSRNG